MTDFKNILIGNNLFSSDWNTPLKNINKKNIILCDFENIKELNEIISNNNISYIIPMSNIDYKLIKSYIQTSNIRIKILYPSEDTYNLLDNKNLFTEFMLNNYIEYIPNIYYLNNIKLKNIEYPAISKPIYSTNAKNIKIIYNDKDLLTLNNYNNIQQFIDYQYEYAAYMLCIDGVIITQKIIRFKYIKYYVKIANFPNTYENVENFNNDIFKNIISKLNYSGGLCINFKVNENNNNNIYIFEINPRFGGSAFTNNFIYELLCIP